MAKPRYKQKCAICKDNMVTIFSYKQFPKCMDCEMKELNKPITDPKMKKMFDIPRNFYEQNYFLRNIKNSYIRFGNLTDKQIEAFKKSVKEIRNKVADSSAESANMKNPKEADESKDKKKIKIKESKE